MELLSWMPIATTALLIAGTFVVSVHGHPYAGRHYSRADRRRYCR